jgi:hypothetical protein
MLGKGTTEIFLTFLLAIIGYFGLTTTLLLSIQRKVPFLLWRIVAAIILVHVIMVWTYRYDWQFFLAVRNGYVGFLLFHSALLMIFISTFVRENIARTLIRISFIVVTIGAVDAVFKYDVVAIYRGPVLVCAAAGVSGLFWEYFKNDAKVYK